MDGSQAQAGSRAARRQRRGGGGVGGSGRQARLLCTIGCMPFRLPTLRNRRSAFAIDEPSSRPTSALSRLPCLASLHSRVLGISQCHLHSARPKHGWMSSASVLGPAGCGCANAKVAESSSMDRKGNLVLEGDLITVRGCPPPLPRRCPARARHCRRCCRPPAACVSVSSGAASLPSALQAVYPHGGHGEVWQVTLLRSAADAELVLDALTSECRHALAPALAQLLAPCASLHCSRARQDALAAREVHALTAACVKACPLPPAPSLPVQSRSAWMPGRTWLPCPCAAAQAHPGGEAAASWRLAHC